MVHALREGWRVLKPGGMLVDQRPLSIDSPVDIIGKGRVEFAGMLDMSPDTIHDIAADKAIASVVKEGIFHELISEQFQVALYWKHMRGMVGDLGTRWKGDVILGKAMIHEGYRLYKKYQGKAQVRLLLTMKLTSYEKLARDRQIDTP